MMLVLIVFIVLGAGAHAQEESLGCFVSSMQKPDLPFHLSFRVGLPENCTKECRKRYYRFSGMMNGEHCYCGSSYGRQGPTNACTTPCTADQSIFCGSFDAISVYSTGVTGSSPPRNLKVTRNEQDALVITWEPPEIPNGDITSYILRAEAVETRASVPLPPIESQVQGGNTNSTTLRGLQPGSKYNISLSAVNEHEGSDEINIITSTKIGPPNKPETPKVIAKNATTITVELEDTTSEYGPISAYQVVVVQFGVTPPTDSDSAYGDYRKSNLDGLGYYITGEFDLLDFEKYKKFVVGDGKTIGGYYNAPLEGGISPGIGLSVVSKDGNQIMRSFSDLSSTIELLRSKEPKTESPGMSSMDIFLCFAIAILGILLIASVLYYVLMRRRHEKIRKKRLPEHQELTLQGPLYEVDNVGYVPDEVPECKNHYQELKEKVWNIPRNFLNVDTHVIARGRFGYIYTGSVQKDGSNVTAGVHSIADRMLKGSEKRLMLRELDACIRAGSMRFLAGLIGTCETSDTLYVAIELPPHNLKQKLLAARSGELFPVDKILTIGSSIAHALAHLEQHKIVHHQLCARNVGLTDDWTPKVMGHGISKYSLSDIKFTRWTAIEMFTEKKKHQPAVVWAFGVLFWEMMSLGATPYADLKEDSDVEEAVVERGIRLPQLPDIPDPIYQVMLSCWQPDAEERPTYDELVRLNTLTLCPITAITEPYVPELELN